MRASISVAVVLCLILSVIVYVLPANKGIVKAQAVNIEDNQISYKHNISPISSKTYCMISNGKTVFNSSANVNAKLDNCEAMQNYLDAVYSLLEANNNASRGEKSHEFTEKLKNIYENYKNVGVKLKDIDGNDKLKDEDEFFDSHNGRVTTTDIANENIKALHLQIQLYYLTYLGAESLANLFKDSLNRIGKIFNLNNPTESSEWITVENNIKHYEKFFTKCEIANTFDCEQIYANELLKSKKNYFQISTQNNQVLTDAEAEHNALEFAKQSHKLETSMNQSSQNASKTLDTLHKLEKALPIREKLYSSGSQLSQYVENMSDEDLKTLEEVGVDTQKYRDLKASNELGYEINNDALELFKDSRGKQMIYSVGGSCSEKTNSMANDDFASCYGAEDDPKFKPTTFLMNVRGASTQEDVIDNDDTFVPIDKNLPKPYIAQTSKINGTNRYNLISDLTFSLTPPVSYSADDNFFEYALKTDAVTDSFFKTTKTGEVWEIPDSAADFTPRVELHNSGGSGYTARWEVTVHYYDSSHLEKGRLTATYTDSNAVGGSRTFYLPKTTVSFDLKVASSTNCDSSTYTDIHPWFYQYWSTNNGGVCSVSMGEEPTKRQAIGSDIQNGRMYMQGIDVPIVHLHNGMKGHDAYFVWTFKDNSGRRLASDTWGCTGAEIHKTKDVAAPANAYFIDLEMFYCYTLSSKKHDDIGSEKYTNHPLAAEQTFSKNTHNGTYSVDHNWNGNVSGVRGNITRIHINTLGPMWDLYELLYSVRDEDGKWHPYNVAGKDWFSTGEWSDDGMKITGIRTKFETVQSQISIASHKRIANNWNERCINLNTNCTGVNNPEYANNNGLYRLGLDNFDSSGKLKNGADPINNFTAVINNSFNTFNDSDIVVGGSFRDAGVGFGERKCIDDQDVALNSPVGSDCKSDLAIDSPYDDTKIGNYMGVNQTNDGSTKIGAFYTEGDGFSVIDHGSDDKKGLDGAYNINSSFINHFRANSSLSNFASKNGVLGKGNDLATNTNKIFDHDKDSNGSYFFQAVSRTNTDTFNMRPVLGNIDYSKNDVPSSVDNLQFFKQSTSAGKVPGFAKNSRLTQIQMQFVGSMAKKFSIYYRVYQKNPQTNIEDWSNWSSNGIPSGNADLDIYAIEIKVMANLSASSPVSSISSFSYINGGVYQSKPKIAYLKNNQWHEADCGSYHDESSLVKFTFENITSQCSSEITDGTIVKFGVQIKSGLHNGINNSKTWSEPFALVKDAKNSVAYFTNGTTGSRSKSNINVFGYGPTEQLDDAVNEVKKQIHNAEVRAAIGWTLFIVGIAATIIATAASGGTAGIVLGIVFAVVVIGLTIADMILAAYKVNHPSMPELSLVNLPKTPENYDDEKGYFKTSGFAFGNTRDHSTNMYLHIQKPDGTKEVPRLIATGTLKEKMFIDQYGAPDYEHQNYSPNPASKIEKGSIIWLDLSNNQNQSPPDFNNVSDNDAKNNKRAKEAFVYDRTSPLRVGVLAYGESASQKLVKYSDSLETQKSIALVVASDEEAYNAMIIQEILDAIAIVLAIVDLVSSIAEAVDRFSQVAEAVEGAEEGEAFKKIILHILPNVIGTSFALGLASAEAAEGLEFETEQWYEVLANESEVNHNEDADVLEELYQYQKDPYSINLQNIRSPLLDKAIDSFPWTNANEIPVHYVIRPYEFNSWFGSHSVSTCQNIPSSLNISTPSHYLNISQDLMNYGQHSVVLDFDLPLLTNFYSFASAPNSLQLGTLDKQGVIVVKPNALSFELDDSQTAFCSSDSNGSIHIKVKASTPNTASDSKHAVFNPLKVKQLVNAYDSNIINATNSRNNYQGLKILSDNNVINTKNTLADPSVNTSSLSAQMSSRVSQAKDEANIRDKYLFEYSDCEYYAHKITNSSNITINHNLSYLAPQNVTNLQNSTQNAFTQLPVTYQNPLCKSSIVKMMVIKYLKSFNNREYQFSGEDMLLIINEIVSDLNKLSLILPKDLINITISEPIESNSLPDFSTLFNVKSLNNSQTVESSVLLSESGQFGLIANKIQSNHNANCHETGSDQTVYAFRYCKGSALLIKDQTKFLVRNDIYDLLNMRFHFTQFKSSQIFIDGIEYRIISNSYQDLLYYDDDELKYHTSTSAGQTYTNINDIDAESQELVKALVDGTVFRVKENLNIHYLYSGISSYFTKPLIDRMQDGAEHMLNLLFVDEWNVEFNINQGIAKTVSGITYNPPNPPETQTVIDQSFLQNVKVPDKINCYNPNIYWDEILAEGTTSKCYEFNGYWAYYSQNGSSDILGTNSPALTTPDLRSCVDSNHRGVQMIDQNGRFNISESQKIVNNMTVYACYLPVDFPIVKNASINLTSVDGYDELSHLSDGLKVNIEIGADLYHRQQTNIDHYYLKLFEGSDFTANCDVNSLVNNLNDPNIYQSPNNEIILPDVHQIDLKYSLCLFAKTDTNVFTDVKHFSFKIHHIEFDMGDVEVESEIPPNYFMPSLLEYDNDGNEEYLYSIKMPSKPIVKGDGFLFQHWSVSHNNQNDIYQVDQMAEFNSSIVISPVYRRQGENINCTYNIDTETVISLSETCELYPESYVGYRIYPEDSINLHNNNMNNDVIVEGIELAQDVANNIDYFVLNKSENIGTGSSGVLLKPTKDLIVTKIRPKFGLVAKDELYETVYSIKVSDHNQIHLLHYKVKFKVNKIVINYQRNKNSSDNESESFDYLNNPPWNFPALNTLPNNWNYPNHYIVGWEQNPLNKTNRNASKYHRSSISQPFAQFTVYKDSSFYAIWRVNTPNAYIVDSKTIKGLQPNGKYKINCVVTSSYNCNDFINSPHYEANASGEIVGIEQWAYHDISIVQLDEINPNWYSNQQILNVGDFKNPQINDIGLDQSSRIIEPMNGSGDFVPNIYKFNIDATDDQTRRENMKYEWEVRLFVDNTEVSDSPFNSGGWVEQNNDEPLSVTLDLSGASIHYAGNFARFEITAHAKDSKGNISSDFTKSFSFHKYQIKTEDVKNYDSHIVPSVLNHVGYISDDYGVFKLENISLNRDDISHIGYCIELIDSSCFDLIDNNVDISSILHITQNLMIIFRAKYRFKITHPVQIDTKIDYQKTNGIISDLLPNETYTFGCVKKLSNSSNCYQFANNNQTFTTDNNGELEIDNSWYQQTINISKNAFFDPAHHAKPYMIIENSLPITQKIPDKMFLVTFDDGLSLTQSNNASLYVESQNSLVSANSDKFNLPLSIPGYSFIGYYDQQTSIDSASTSCLGNQYVDFMGYATDQKIFDITHLYACYLDVQPPDVEGIKYSFDQKSYDDSSDHSFERVHGIIDLSDVFDESSISAANYGVPDTVLQYRISYREAQINLKNYIYYDDSWQDVSNLSASNYKVDVDPIVENDKKAYVYLQLRDSAKNYTNNIEFSTKQMHQIKYELGTSVLTNEFTDSNHYFELDGKAQIERFPGFADQKDESEIDYRFWKENIYTNFSDNTVSKVYHQNSSIDQIDEDHYLYASYRYKKPQLHFDYETGVFFDAVPEAYYQISINDQKLVTYYTGEDCSFRFDALDEINADNLVLEVKRVSSPISEGINIIESSESQEIIVNRNLIIPSVSDFVVKPTQVVSGVSQNNGSIKLVSQNLMFDSSKLEYCILQSVKNININSEERCGEWIDFPDVELTNLSYSVLKFRLRGGESTHMLPSQPSENIAVKATDKLQNLITVSVNNPNEKLYTNIKHEFNVEIDCRLILPGEEANVKIMHASGKVAKVLSTQFVGSKGCVDLPNFTVDMSISGNELAIGKYYLELELLTTKVKAVSNEWAMILQPTIKPNPPSGNNSGGNNSGGSNSGNSGNNSGGSNSGGNNSGNSGSSSKPSDDPKNPVSKNAPSMTSKPIKITFYNHMKSMKGTDVLIEWQKAISVGANVTNYYISLSDIFGRKLINHKDIKLKTKYLFTNLTVGNYKITLSAKNIYGESKTVSKTFLIKLPLLTNAALSKLAINFKDLAKIKKNQKQRYLDIMWLAKAQVTIGSGCDKSKKSKCLYAPSSSVTRGAMADFMYKLIGQPNKGSIIKEQSYLIKDQEMLKLKKLVVDGKKSMRYNNILWLVKTRITNGCEIKNDKPSKYCPQNMVTRGAMSEFMYKLSGSPNNVTKTIKSGKNKGLQVIYPDPNYKDAKDSNKNLKYYEKAVSKDLELKKLKKSAPWRYWSIIWLIKYNITVPDHQKFNPNNRVTRGAMAQFMHKLYYIVLTAKAVPKDNTIPKGY